MPTNERTNSTTHKRTNARTTEPALVKFKCSHCHQRIELHPASVAWCVACHRKLVRE